LLGLFLGARVLAQSVTVAPCGVSGVTVAGAPSADYFEQVDEVLGAARPLTLNVWLPYGVALTNRAPQNIVAIAVRWLVTNSKGQAAVFSITSMTVDQPRLQTPPGKSVIAVPVAVLNAAPRTLAGPGHRLAEFQGAQKIEVSLDGVVFASGQFVGPNSGKAYEQFVAETTVPAHVASTIMAMKEVGETIGTVVAWLESSTKPRSADRKAQITARVAKTLLTDYQRGGEALLYEKAQGYEKTPAIRLYR
jgi:uncharacterized protein affecting Mg2+/Co2+ transport